MQYAVLTGASSGIGESILKVLIQRGYTVYALGHKIKQEKLDGYSDKENSRIIEIETDLLDIEKSISLLEKAENFKEISLLVNNAGVGYFGPHEEISVKHIREMCIVNLELPLALTARLLRVLKANKGNIINISSESALEAAPHGCAYSATKAAMAQFSKSLFAECRKYEVGVCVLHPEMTKTNFYRNADFETDEDEETYLLPEDVAKAVEFVLDARKGAVVRELTIMPQKHKIKRKNRS